MGIRTSKKTSSNQIKIQMQKRVNTKPEVLPPHVRDRYEAVSKYPMRNPIRGDVQEVDTPRKLARKVYHRYGSGTYNVMIWGQYKNRDYDPKKKCKPGKRGHQTCKKGRACKKNPRWKHNWLKRGRITVRDAILKNPEYEYTWHKDHDRMYRFKWWKGEDE